MHPIEQRVNSFLESIADNPMDEIPADILEDFKEHCAQALIKHFATVREDTFRLRMSNIGKPLRSLWLEKNHGSSINNTPSFKRKMLFGDLTEALEVAIMKLAGVNVQCTNQNTELDIAGRTIKGEFDIKIDGDIYDVKSTSNWAFNNKFINWETLAEDDSFGYTGQLFGYAMAEDTKAGGFIAINKETGEMKVVTPPEINHEYDLTKQEIYDNIVYKINFLDTDEEPPCPGPQKEKFRGKETGNMILGTSCRFCNHKDKCHPTATYEPSRPSTAQNPPWVWYLSDEE